MPTKLILHIDMNSFFASCEQQANRLLRGRPVGVCAYNAPSSVILAASIEAKKYGIKTGTIARDAKKLCPNIRLLENDPPKYRYISDKIGNILLCYSNQVEPYSIDESFVDLTGWAKSWDEAEVIAKRIKKDIKNQAGDYLTCSIGISFTKFLAKVGSDMKKPDGLTVIKPADLPGIYAGLQLTDLWGLAAGWEKRLARLGIITIRQLYNYPLQNLVSIFGKPGHSLYAHIHGLDADPVIHEKIPPKSISHQYAIPRAEATPSNLPRILMKLCEKVGRRLRKHGLLARQIFIYTRFRARPALGKHILLPYPVRGTLDIYHHAVDLLRQEKTITSLCLLSIGVARFTTPNEQLALSFFSPPLRGGAEGGVRGKIQTFGERKKNDLDDVLDAIKNKYGDFAIVRARMLGSEQMVPDSIGFGK